MECHLMKLIANKEHIAEVKEEIVQYEPEKEDINSCVIIIEHANNDLQKYTEIQKITSEEPPQIS